MGGLWNFWGSLFGRSDKAEASASPDPIAPASTPQLSADAAHLGGRGYQQGDQIAKGLTVLDVLGWGGFGVVYLVEVSQIQASDLPQCHFVWSQKMALKTLRDEYLVDPRVRQRFRHEAQVLVDLGRHPFLVDCSGVYEIADRLYIATEYVAPDANGLNSLEGYLHRCPPDLAQSLRWAIQVCYGMEYAYSNGLRCHRDLKPANVLITADGTVKVADFGLAGALEQARLPDGIRVHVEDGRVGLSGQTLEGASFGTPTHMPPEQFSDAASCDERSDVYAFGVILYQLATGGQLPFLAAPPRNPSPVEMARFWSEMRQLQTTANVPQLNSPIFPIIKRCLAKKPDQRYPSFRELRRELESLLRRQAGVLVDPPKVRGLSAGDWCRKGDILATLGHREEAVACYDRALATSPRFVAAWNNKGRCLADQGRPEEALACYDQALALDPRSIDAWKNKGTFLASRGRLEEAIDCYDRALALYANDAIGLYNKGLCLAKLGRREEAIECYDRAASVDPGFAAPWNNKALGLYQLGRREEAIDCYDQALALDPECPVTWFNKGLCLYALRKWANAIDCYDQALALDPTFASAWHNKGLCLAKLRRREEALASYQRALALNPHDLHARYTMGLCLVKLGRPQEATDCIDQTLLGSRHDTATWYSRGLLLAALERWQEAVTSFDRAVELDPSLVGAWFNKARAEGRIGRVREAMRSYERFIAVAPPAEYARHIKHAQRRLRKLKR